MNYIEASKSLVKLYAEYRKLTHCDSEDFAEAIAKAIAALTIVGEMGI